MMRSLYAAVSGLKGNQTYMDVIGNNIANVNTTGYKASNVTFQDMLSQTLQGASSPSGTQGGTNPMQVGLGVGVGSISTNFTDGSTQSTGISTNLAISGDGFFVVGTPTNQMYTRSGDFTTDEQGNFVNSSGYSVLGWPADASGVVDTTEPISALQIPVGSTMPAKVSTTITFSGNLNASATAGADSAQPVSYDLYDTQGNKYTLTGSIVKTAANIWTFTPTSPIVGGTDGKTTVATVTGGTATIVFKTDGTLDDASTNFAALTINPTGPYAGAGAFTVQPSGSTMTQNGSDSTAKISNTDGYAAGTLNGKTISSTGEIIGSFTNGLTQAIGQVALAVFNNPDGLLSAGGNLYTKTTNSGEAQIGSAGTGGRGSFTPGSLEMSNVDLAQQFTNMIVAQRAFQANSKIITTDDNMLEELVNLKR